MTDQDHGPKESLARPRLRIVVFACHRSAPATDGTAQWPEEAAIFEWRIIRQPCSEKLQVAHVLRVLEEGIDGVCVVACPEEECEFLGGSRRIRKRVERAQSLLEEIGLGGNRVALIHVSPWKGPGVFEDQVVAAARGLEALGPSPLRRG